MESMSTPAPATSRSTAALAQRGAVLIVALVVLALMSLAAASVVRSTDTANLIAGNLTFRHATLHASDIAGDRAWEELVTGTYSSKSYYFSTVQTNAPDFSSFQSIAEDAIWNNADVPCVDERGANVGCDDESAMRIQHVIERQCAADPDLASMDSIKENCDVDPATVNSVPPAIYFRVLIRARGPRGTLGFYELMISGPAV